MRRTQATLAALLAAATCSLTIAPAVAGRNQGVPVQGYVIAY